MAYLIDVVIDIVIDIAIFLIAIQAINTPAKPIFLYFKMFKRLVPNFSPS